MDQDAAGTATRKGTRELVKPEDNEVAEILKETEPKQVAQASEVAEISLTTRKKQVLQDALAVVALSDERQAERRWFGLFRRRKVKVPRLFRRLAVESTIKLALDLPKHVQRTRHKHDALGP